MYHYKKNDGKNVDFNLQKISDAIRMAFEAQEKQYHPSIIDFLALKVTADFQPKIKEGLISVEDIQDSVEFVLDRRVTPTLPRLIFCTAASVKNSAPSRPPRSITRQRWTTTENQRLARQGKLTVTYSVGGLILSNSGSDYGKLLALRSLR
ncbi:MAG: ATP cone domain-containing protein [Victivallales bacterium]